MPYSNQIAEGITAEDGFTPFQLMAGDGPVVTDQATAGAAITQFRTLGRVTATQKLIPHDPTAVDGSEVIVAVAAQAASADGVVFPIYVGGIFNHEALGWHASLDTLAERKQALDGTMLGVRQLL